MAILNITPDSFFEGSRTPGAAAAEERVRRAVAEGASIIDVGGYSSRPGADEVSPDEELRRVAEGVAAVRRIAPDMPVSVDTFRAEVAAKCIESFGRVIINDISAGEIDPEIIRVAVRFDVPYIAMHMRGTPDTMQTMTDYGDVTAEVVEYFRAKTSQLSAAGMRRENIVLDPGFGFAKTLEQNYELLGGLHRLRETGYPVLAGLSRKSMIYRLLGTTPAESLAGTTALNWECLRQGASILRVHDVREAVETVKIFERFRLSSPAAAVPCADRSPIGGQLKNEL
ncbi:MAG: dihydropteroate synthase [Alistipes sp.]|nr:dihydropteroate synthase [Alistipes sp.]